MLNCADWVYSRDANLVLSFWNLFNRMFTGLDKMVEYTAEIRVCWDKNKSGETALPNETKAFIEWLARDHF